MMSKADVEIVRRVYEAFNSADARALSGLLSADCVMDWSRSMGPLRGVYTGVDGAAEWMAAIAEAFEEFRLEPSEYIVCGERIVVSSRVVAKGRGSGVDVTAAGSTVWELRDRKVVGFTLYRDRDEALEAARLS